MKWVVLDKFGKNIAVFKHFTLNYVFIFAMNFNEREFRKNFLSRGFLSGIAVLFMDWMKSFFG